MSFPSFNVKIPRPTCDMSLFPACTRGSSQNLIQQNIALIPSKQRKMSNFPETVYYFPSPVVG